MLLTDAVKDGARCLDGSPGGYYLRTHNAKGVAADPKKWILFMQVPRAPPPPQPASPDRKTRVYTAYNNNDVGCCGCTYRARTH